MPFLKIDFLKFIYASCLIAFFIIIYTLQSSQESPSLVVAPHSVNHFFQRYYYMFADSVSSTTRQYLQLLTLKKELREVQVENQKLKAKLQVLKELKLENQRLEELLEYKSEVPSFHFIVAKVTARDLMSDHFSLFINKGSEEGITKLAGVISPKGVVGYVTDVKAHSARILFLTDRLSSIDATVQRTRARGIISGYAWDATKLKYIERPEDMQEGDLVITSSDQKTFPPGYPIGTIVAVNTKPSGVGHQAHVEPAADLKKLEEVIILKAKK